MCAKKLSGKYRSQDSNRLCGYELCNFGLYEINLTVRIYSINSSLAKRKALTPEDIYIYFITIPDEAQNVDMGAGEAQEAEEARAREGLAKRAGRGTGGEAGGQAERAW